MDLQYAFELIGTFVFAISGALAVREKEHDLFGAGFTGFITAIGGGTLRDILLDAYPLVWIGNVQLLYSIFAGIVAAFIFPKFLSKLRRTFFLFDTLGIGFFTVLGVEKALSLGVRPEIAAIMGMFTAVMGGVIRDTLTNDIPILFRKEVYASACLAGAIAYVALNHFEVERNYNLFISMALVVGIRMIAMKYKLSLPTLD
jgi:uncharacterized membrane protein YeiH